MTGICRKHSGFRTSCLGSAGSTLASGLPDWDLPEALWLPDFPIGISLKGGPTARIHRILAFVSAIARGLIEAALTPCWLSEYRRPRNVVGSPCLYPPVSGFVPNLGSP